MLLTKRFEEGKQPFQENHLGSHSKKMSHMKNKMKLTLLMVAFYLLGPCDDLLEDTCWHALLRKVFTLSFSSLELTGNDPQG